MEYASNGKANAGLATGIIGTALGAINSMGGLAYAQANTNPEETAVTRHELNYVEQIANKDHTIAKLEAQQYTDAAVKGLSDQIAVWKNNVDNRFAANDVLNTQQTATMACMQSQVNLLMSMTKLVIPNASVNPGWGDVTITPAGAATVKGAVPSSNG